MFRQVNRSLAQTVTSMKFTREIEAQVTRCPTLARVKVTYVLQKTLTIFSYTVTGVNLVDVPGNSGREKCSKLQVVAPSKTFVRLMELVAGVRERVLGS